MVAEFVRPIQERTRGLPRRPGAAGQAARGRRGEGPRGGRGDPAVRVRAGRVLPARARRVAPRDRWTASVAGGAARSVDRSGGVPPTGDTIQIGIAVDIPEPWGAQLTRRRVEAGDPLRGARARDAARAHRDPDGQPARGRAAPGRRRRRAPAVHAAPAGHRHVPAGHPGGVRRGGRRDQRVRAAGRRHRRGAGPAPRAAGSRTIRTSPWRRTWRRRPWTRCTRIWPTSPRCSRSTRSPSSRTAGRPGGSRVGTSASAPERRPSALSTRRAGRRASGAGCHYSGGRSARMIA